MIIERKYTVNCESHQSGPTFALTINKQWVNSCHVIWHKDSQYNLPLQKRQHAFTSFLNVRISENCKLNHMINNCLNGIKIKPEKMTICFKSFHENISHKTEKKLFRVFWVGDNFPKIPQFYSDFAHGETEVQQKNMFFTNFNHYLISIDCINGHMFHTALLPGVQMEATTTPGLLSSWKPTQSHAVALTQLWAHAWQECNCGSTAAGKGPHISFAADADAHVTLSPSLVLVPWSLHTKEVRASLLKLLWWGSLRSVEIWLDQPPKHPLWRDWVC